MAVRPILHYPDQGLRTPARPVEDFGEALRSLAEDLRDTMRAAPGIGITAPHIGVPLRVVVLELSPGDVRSYVNPVIRWSSKDVMRHEEGSISMPGVTEVVERPARVRLGYQDLAGAEQELEADGLLGICLQHEIDQLDGVFWIQRLSRLRRERLVKRYNKLIRTV